MKKVNTNQNHAMVIVSKMLKDIIGKDKLLEAYRKAYYLAKLLRYEEAYYLFLDVAKKAFRENFNKE